MRVLIQRVVASRAGRAVLSRSFAERLPEIEIIGVPLDMGAGRRGVDMGPSAIRLGNLHGALTALGYKLHDMGQVPVLQVEEARGHETKNEGQRLNANYHLLVGEAAHKLSLMTEKAACAGRIPLVLGGDHSIAAGSLAGTQRGRVSRNLKPAGLIWIDAHADINTPETSPSGNLHGMPMAALTGLPVPGLSKAVGGAAGQFDVARIAYVGLRDVDPLERNNLRRAGFIEGKNVFTMTSIDTLGMYEVMQRVLHIVAPAFGDKYCLSFDVDAVDPSIAPGVGTPVTGGLTFREAHLAMEMIAKHGGMCHMDVVEVNPYLDTANRTGLLAVDMIESAFGKTTLDPKPSDRLVGRK